MRSILKYVGIVSVLIGTATIPSNAHAEPASSGAAGITAKCPATGPGVVACVAIGATLHELVKLGNGEDAFWRERRD